MEIARVREEPRGTYPFTDEAWAAINAAGLEVDKRLAAGAGGGRRAHRRAAEARVLGRVVREDDLLARAEPVGDGEVRAVGDLREP